MQDLLRHRLNVRAKVRWPQLARVQVRFRSGFAYAAGELPGEEEPLPLCRLRFTGRPAHLGLRPLPHQPRQVRGQLPAHRTALRLTRRRPGLRLRLLPRRPHALINTPPRTAAEQHWNWPPRAPKRARPTVVSRLGREGHGPGRRPGPPRPHRTLVVFRRPGRDAGPMADLPGRQGRPAAANRAPGGASRPTRPGAARLPFCRHRVLPALCNNPPPGVHGPGPAVDPVGGRRPPSRKPRRRDRRHRRCRRGRARPASSAWPHPCESCHRRPYGKPCCAVPRNSSRRTRTVSHRSAPHQRAGSTTSAASAKPPCRAPWRSHSPAPTIDPRGGASAPGRPDLSCCRSGSTWPARPAWTSSAWSSPSASPWPRTWADHCPRSTSPCAAAGSTGTPARAWRST